MSASFEALHLRSDAIVYQDIVYAIKIVFRLISVYSIYLTILSVPTLLSNLFCMWRKLRIQHIATPQICAFPGQTRLSGRCQYNRT